MEKRAPRSQSISSFKVRDVSRERQVALQAYEAPVVAGSRLIRMINDTNERL